MQCKNTETVLTSELGSSLDDLVDLFEAVQQLVVVVGAHLIAADQLLVQTVQPPVRLTHPTAIYTPQRSHH